MFLQLIILIIGFVVLIKGADIFVDGASSTARNFNVSKMLISLTIVAFGTSAPELAISIKSFTDGNTDMVLGNVIGSNILNILLILGISSVIYNLKVKDNTVRKEIPIVVLISTLLIVLSLDSLFDKNMTNLITRSDGIVLLLFFSIFIYYLFSIMRRKKENNEKIEEDPPKYKMTKSIVFTIMGMIAIIIGSNLVVNSATTIADKLGVSQRMISLTIVAFGTSLPELVTSVMAAIKKESDIAIGNVVGSNIFNLGLVLGLPVAIFGGFNVNGFSSIDLIMLIASAVLLYIFCKNDRKITRNEGIIFLIIFVAYYSYVIIG